MTDETLFAQALDRTDPAARREYLDAACPDPQQRDRVEKLLAALGRASDFLERPPFEDESPAGPGPTRAARGGPDGDEPEEVNEPLDFLDPPVRPDSLGRLGHYEVLQVVGKGGFGTVFRAFDDVLQRVVAIKVLSREMAATSPARKRFVREARGYAAIRHENVVVVHDIQGDPRPYIVMEFVPGETLEHLITRTGPIDARDVARIGMQIARGLAAAHDRGIVHRDIKPANVLIESGPERKVKLTDFGLARAADDASLTQSGMIAGTPMYMAPEQAYGTPLDGRADLFSLGSVLYTLCTGRPPFRASTSLAVLRRVAEEDPRPIHDLIPETPQALVDVVTRLHAKSPDDRFQTAAEVADRLAKFLSGEPDTTAVPKPPPAVAPPGRPEAEAPGAATAAPKAEPAPAGRGWATRAGVGALAGLVVLVLGALAVYALRPPAPERPPQPEGAAAPKGPELPDPPPRPKLPEPPPKPKLPLPPRPLTGVAAVLASDEWEWGEPKNLGPNVNNGVRALGAALSSDELDIVFARGKLGEAKLYTSHRNSVDDDFGPAELLPPAINAAVGEAASLSGDGLTLAFSRRRGAAPEEIWVSERASWDKPFGEPTRLPEAVNVPEVWARAPVLSADGRTLLVTTPPRGIGPGDVVMFVREPGGPFAHRPLPGQYVNSPDYDVASWVSDDRLALVRVRMAPKAPETRLHVRESDDAPFGEGRKLVIPGVPENKELGRPWLSPDGARLYFHLKEAAGNAGDIDIWVAERKRKAR